MAIIPITLLLAVAARSQPVGPDARANEAFLFTPPGFAEEGKPLWVSGAETGQVQIVVHDAANGRVTPCRVNVVGPDGNYYQPPENRLSLYALTGSFPQPNSKGNRAGKAPFRYLGRFFYTTGESTVAVPPGTVRVEVWKGFEYRPETVSIQIAAGATRRVEVSLMRTAPMDERGYYAGDSHLHLPRLTDEDDQIAFDLIEAEDFRYGFLLAYNEPANRYEGFMNSQKYPQSGTGARTVRTRGNTHIASGQEYRSTTYGHLNLYFRDDLVRPGSRHITDDWPVHGEVGRETITRGGHAFMAHGGYGQEIWADAALGTVSAVELLQFGVYRGIELQGWYTMLNSGYRFAALGSSDYPPCRMLADCRTYAYSPVPPSMPEWIAAVAGGRSFFTTAPLVLLEVDGEQPGGQIRRNGPGPHSVRARLRVRSEITPVTDIDLIVNGRVIEHRALPRTEGQGRWIEMEREIPIGESSWIAARAYSTASIKQPDAEAHTNPVYVYLRDRAPFQPAALDAWIAQVDRQIAIHAQRDFPERANVRAYHQRARDVLQKIRDNGGLAADADPAKLAAEPASDQPGTIPPANGTSAIPAKRN